MYIYIFLYKHINIVNYYYHNIISVAASRRGVGGDDKISAAHGTDAESWCRTVRQDRRRRRRRQDEPINQSGLCARI